MARKRLVIIGGGFGGLALAMNLGDKRLEILLIDKNNYHLFQPLLYQVATGGLSPANIATPLRTMLRSRKEVKVIMGEVADFFPAAREIAMTDGTRVSYDLLAMAAGTTNQYFSHPEWETYAPGLKTINDATEIRARILGAFEIAEKTSDPKQTSDLLTFVIVGGGPTGVEMAGAISDLARKTMKGEFRHLHPELARVILIEGSPKVLNAFGENLSKKATESLHRLGVETWTKAKVLQIDEEKVVVQKGEIQEIVNTRTVFWAAGVRANPLAEALAKATDIIPDRTGRIPVKRDLSLENYPEIFVLGDIASYSHSGNTPLPGIAPVAMQQGKFLAHLITARMDGSPDPEFEYHDRGTMATIGRSAAVAQIGKLQFSGFFAWITWLFIHLMFLVQFQNRIMVLFQWGWNYITFNRSARLITKK